MVYYLGLASLPAVVNDVTMLLCSCSIKSMMRFWLVCICLSHLMSSLGEGNGESHLMLDQWFLTFSPPRLP